MNEKDIPYEKGVDQLFRNMMGALIPNEAFKESDKYADDADELVNSFADNEFFDTKYYHLISSNITKVQQKATIMNLLGVLHPKAFRMTYYISLKEHLLAIEDVLKNGIIGHPEIFTKEDLERADNIAEKLFQNLKQHASTLKIFEEKTEQQQEPEKKNKKKEKDKEDK